MAVRGGRWERERLKRQMMENPDTIMIHLCDAAFTVDLASMPDDEHKIEIILLRECAAYFKRDFSFREFIAFMRSKGQ